MKTKKLITLFIVLALVISMLCVMLIACNDKKEPDPDNQGETTDEGDGGDEGTGDEGTGDEGTGDEEGGDEEGGDDVIVPSKLDVEEVKEAAEPIVKVFIDAVSDEINAKIDYTELMQLEDEMWEYFTSEFEEIGITQQTLDYISENATPVIEKILNAFNRNGWGEYPANEMQAYFDLEFVQQALKVTNYIADNLTPGQTVKLVSLFFGSIASIDSGYVNMRTMYGVDKMFTVEEISQLFEAIGKKDVFISTYSPDIPGLESILSDVTDIVSTDTGNAVVKSLMTALLKFNGASAEEVKGAMDVAFEFLGVGDNDEYTGDYVYTALNQLTASQIKNALAFVEKLVDGLVGDDAAYAAFCSVADEIVPLVINNIGGTPDVDEYINLQYDNIKEVLPYVAPMLNSITESDIQSIIDGYGDYIEANETEAAYNRFLLSSVKTLLKYLNMLPAENSDIFLWTVFNCQILMVFKE